MNPDTPRSEIVIQTRRPAAAIHESAYRRVTFTMPPSFEPVAAMLLARLAGLGDSVAALLAAGCDLDARLAMRSSLEHLTLLAWLAIDTAEMTEDRRGKVVTATNPDANTAWWFADQLRRDQRSGERRHQVGVVEIGAEWRDAVRAAKSLMKQHNRGKFPSVEAMAKEADAAWGDRLAGWPGADAPVLALTLQRMYWTLYQVGSASVHPGLGVLLNTFLQDADGHGAEVVRARADDQVDLFAGVTAYLLLYAAAIAQRFYGGTVLDDALRALDRFDVVAGPARLLERIDHALDATDGRRSGVTGGSPISVERLGKRRTVVVVADDGWTSIAHGPESVWIIDGSDRLPVAYERSAIDGPVAATIRDFRLLVEAADWQQTPEWPGGVP